ncbi:MAG TPA: nicotinate-nucleotide adenylyltransferase [Candidatus Cloacimonadota bacterium]|nr:nicotinate-nucleotide adenylyltransferase [Candidatus Cloacimonadota bacterium]HPT72068.1 nicotinate-nucleotide adenylyltransferase [Candidatus Cloacimonadota bacterium]
MQIGLLGGSFNPIHNGHIEIALAVRNRLKLDTILLLPAGKHPFSQKNSLLPVSKRIDLIRKAIRDIHGLEVSEADADETRSSYTDELLLNLESRYPNDELFFIIGADNIAQLPQWHNWDWLKDNAKFICVNRPDTDLTLYSTLNYVKNITFVTIPPIPISSTQIRQLVKEGKPITGLVPPSIERDIVEMYSSLIKN